jgi:hypothetical protein
MDFSNINSDVVLDARDVISPIHMDLPMLREIWMKYSLSFLGGLQSMELDDLQEWWRSHLQRYWDEGAKLTNAIKLNYHKSNRYSHTKTGNIFDKKIPLIMRDVRSMSSNYIYCKWFEKTNDEFNLFIW